MTDSAKTYALWGTGELTPESAKALLEEYIPDNVGTVYRPERVTREEKGLRTALDWFESPDFLGAGGAVPSTDLRKSLANDAEEHGDEVFLLALWPEVPSHADFDFIEAVQMDGIPVLDLSRAMDHLDLSLYSRPEPTREEKAAARAAARAEKKTADKKLSDELPGQMELTPEPEAKPEELLPALTLTSDAARLWARVEETKDAFDQALREYMETITVDMIPVREAIEAKEDVPFDGPYVGQDTKEYFWRKSTNAFRVAEGKPRRGETVVNFTDEEARERGLLDG